MNLRLLLLLYLIIIMMITLTHQYNIKLVNSYGYLLTSCVLANLLNRR